MCFGFATMFEVAAYVRPVLKTCDLILSSVVIQKRRDDAGSSPHSMGISV